MERLTMSWKMKTLNTKSPNYKQIQRWTEVSKSNIEYLVERLDEFKKLEVQTKEHIKILDILINDNLKESYRLIIKFYERLKLENNNHE